MKLAAFAMFALVMATPVFADPPDEFSGDRQARSNSSDDVIDPLQGTRFETCVRLMQRAFYMADPRDLDRALDAHREMERARDAFQDGDESACEHHAILALQDRT